MDEKSRFAKDVKVSARHGKVDFYQADYWGLPRFRAWPFYPFCIEETIRRIPTWFRERNCPFMMMVFLLEGQVNYECEGGCFALTPGKLLVLPLGSIYAFESETCGGYYHKIVLELKGVNLSSLAETLGLNKALLLDFPDSAALAGKCRWMGSLLRSQSEDCMPALMGQLYELLNQLSLLAQSPEGESHLLAIVQSRLESKLDEPLKVPQLAEDLGVSCATINRLFRKNLKTSPQKYRMWCRVERAKELLENTSLSVKEIASRVGYCHQFHFTSEFRRLTGCKPSECRRKTETGPSA